MSTNLEAALAYAARGWHVFPVMPHRGAVGSEDYKTAKRPVGWLVRGGHNDATTDPETIERWWSQVPRARVGLACRPSGVLVIDHDDYKEHAAQLPPLPETLTSVTPQGGKHFFFAYPEGEWTDRREHGLDTKGNGYVILPSPDAGGYEWMPGPERSMVMYLPPELTEFLLKREEQGPGPQTTEEIEDRERFLVEEISLRSLGDYRVKGEDAKGRVLVELERCPFDAADHAHPFKAIIGIGSKGEPFAHCVMAGCGGRGWRDLPAPDYSHIEWTEVGIQPGEHREWNGADLARASLPPIEFLPLFGCDGYIPEGFSTLLAAPPKAGKTTLLRTMVREWLDIDRSVLLLTEEPDRLWQPRLDGDPEDWAGLTLLPAFGSSSEAMLERIRLADEDIVIIDTGRSVIRWQDENDNAGMERTVRPWIQAARTKNRTFLVLHHARKGGGQFGEEISGGHALFGLFDQALVLKRDEVSAADKKLGLRPDQNLRWVQGWGRFGTVATMAYGLDGSELKLEKGRVPSWDV